jgi:hypothetical protein
MTSIAIDDFSYRRAKALLARELPTKDQEFRFKRTKTLTLVAVGLTLAWIVVLIAYAQAQIFVLMPAAVCYLLAELYFLSNISYLQRLWKSWKMARRLKFSRLRALRARTPLIDRLSSVALLALVLLGLLVIYVSLAGLVEELEAGDVTRAAGAVASLVFGVMCLLLYPMAWVRDRVHAVSAIHAELESAAAGSGDTPIEIHLSVYNDLAEIERTQIETDRAEIKSGSHRINSSMANAGLHISADFFQAMARLDPHQVAHVRQALDVISTDKRERVVEGEPSVEHMSVPSTNLAIELRRRSGRRVEIVNLRPADASYGGDRG